MEEQDDQVGIPENQQRHFEFIEAMMEARNENAPMQVIQDILDDAPPLSVKVMYLWVAFFLPRIDVPGVLLEHEPKIANP